MTKVNVVITAGGTTEKIDNVRKITNMSTGKLGVKICNSLIKHHMKNGNINKIFYIHSKTAELPQIDVGHKMLGVVPDVELIEIESVADLQNAIHNVLTQNTIDYFIHSAAVSDYAVDWVSNSNMIGNLIDDFEVRGIDTPEVLLRGVNNNEVYKSYTFNRDSKIGSDNDDLIIRLTKTPKIIGEIKKLSPKTFLVGFKLLNGVPNQELFDVGFNLLRKNRCNLVLANDLAKIKAGNHQGMLIYPEKEYDLFNGKDAIAKNLVQIMFERGEVKHPNSIQLSEYCGGISDEDLSNMKLRGKCLDFYKLLPKVDGGTYGNISIMTDNGMYITGRNVNKGDLKTNSIVNIDRCEFVNDHPSVFAKVYYHGSVKPSIDTAIHYKLYKLLKCKAIIHVHTKKVFAGYPITDKNYPCGSLEELNSILRVLEKEPSDVIQLYKHGLIIFGDSLNDCASKLDKCLNGVALEKITEEDFDEEIWNEWQVHRQEISNKYNAKTFDKIDNFYYLSKGMQRLGTCYAQPSELINGDTDNGLLFSLYVIPKHQNTKLGIGTGAMDVLKRLFTRSTKDHENCGQLILVTSDKCGVEHYYEKQGFKRLYASPYFNNLDLLRDNDDVFFMIKFI